MKTVKCSICGRTFKTNRPNKKYCSFICKEAGRIVSRHKWEADHPGYNAEYARARRAKAREGE